MKRRYFLKGAFSSITLLTTTGCLTTYFYKSYDTSGKYQDTIISFLITEDGTKFVVLSEKYHYIFDVGPHLKQVLMGTFRPVVEVHLSSFYLTNDNRISGNYALSLSKDATDEQRKSAVDVGFTADTGSRLSLSGHLVGVRYSAEGFPAIAKIYKFNRPYVVDIKTEEKSGAKIAGKILLTPIVVAADGALILAGIALILLSGLGNGEFRISR